MDCIKSRSGAGGRTWVNWLNLAAYIVNTVVTFSSLTGIFGPTNQELSAKYQTLVTPAGYAFSIWGIIFTWEGIFVIAQLCPQFSSSELVAKMSPWWWGACIAQVAWTLAFARESIPLSLFCMLSILASLLGVSFVTDGMPMTVMEYLLLRAPLSLHLGWIFVASIVNVNVVADWAKSSQEVLLCFAVVSYAAAVTIAALFTFAVKSADPFIGLVAAWAFFAINVELSDPTNLNNPDRWNYSEWPTMVLNGLKMAAVVVSIIALMLGLVAGVLRGLSFWKASGRNVSAMADNESEESDSAPEASA